MKAFATWASACIVIVVAFAMRDAIAGPIERVFTAVTCSSSSACASYKNTAGTAVSGTTSAINTNPKPGPSIVAGLVGINTGVSKSGNAAGIGIYGQSASGPGVAGYTSGSNGAGMLGIASNNDGVEGQTSNKKFAGIVGENTAGGYTIVAANAAGNSSVMTVDSKGDIQNNGTLETSGDATFSKNVAVQGTLSVNHGCNGCKSSTALASYASLASAPILEDFGEGNLVAGAASVRFDTRFAAAISRESGYLVFITPEGDNRGLYVSAKTPGGFQVRESQGGRSSIPFSYRIVARPYGSAAQRLPLVSTTSQAARTNL